MLLQISDVRPDDVGVYRVVATNPAGQASTQCKVSLIPDRRGVDNQPAVGPEKYLNLRPIPTKAGPEEQNADLMRPPKVIVPLVDSVLEEMMPVILTATVDAGIPMATVSDAFAEERVSRWFLYGTLVHLAEEWSTVVGRQSVHHHVRHRHAHDHPANSRLTAR